MYVSALAHDHTVGRCGSIADSFHDVCASVVAASLRSKWRRCGLPCCRPSQRHTSMSESGTQLTYTSTNIWIVLPWSAVLVHDSTSQRNHCKKCIVFIWTSLWITKIVCCLHCHVFTCIKHRCVCVPIKYTVLEELPCDKTSNLNNKHLGTDLCLAVERFRLGWMNLTGF